VSALLYQTIYRQPVRYDYPLLRPPTLPVVGAEARTAVMRQYGNRADTAEMGNFPVLAQAACREMARCELIVIPQTGHVPHLEHPDAFIERLLGFLNSNAASAADRPWSDESEARHSYRRRRPPPDSAPGPSQAFNERAGLH
jgi:hypothetical protein